MRRGGLLGAAALVLALALSACGSGTTTTSSSPAATSTAGSDTATAAPDGGTLRWAINANVSWDPVTSAAGNEVRHLGLVYEALVHIDPTGKPTPGLALSWQFSKSGLALTFKLRPNVAFTDGSPFNADVAKTNLLRAKDQPGSALSQLLDSVKSIAVVDPETIKLNLSYKDYGLPLVLGGKAGMMVSGKAIADDLKGLPNAPVGAGPFKLTKFIPNGSSTLVKNPGYWDAKDIHLDGVDLEYLTDPQSILAGLESGSIDMASSTGDQIQAAKSAGLNVLTYPSLAAASIEVNSAMKPFDNHLVVEAVNSAIDREALIKTDNGGLGDPAYQPFPKGYPGYDAAVANLYPYDPAKARQLLAQAGLAKGVHITITYFDSGSYKALSEQLQAQLQAVGISSSLVSLPLAQASEVVYVKHEVAFNPNGIVGRESPLQMLNVQYGADGLLNPGRSASPELSAALKDAAQYPSDDPRFEPALEKATGIAAKQSAVVFLFTQPTVTITTKKVSGVPQNIVAQRLEGVRLAK